MTASPEYLEHLLDALLPLGDVRARRMFGGAGVFLDGTMFGLVFDDMLFLKADAETVGAFEAEGLQAITYERLGKTIALSYWEAPERLLDDQDELLEWCRRAWQAGRRTGAGKTKRNTAGKTKRRRA